MKAVKPLCPLPDSDERDLSAVLFDGLHNATCRHIAI
jgi:hypothetical protein